MVYTVTFNPAIDYVVHTKEMQVGQVNRSESEEIYFGGKGINVSFVLHELGIPSKALGFVAGFTGAALENGVQASGIETDFVHLKNGFSRINVKIKSEEETDLNGQGPVIDEAALQELFEKLKQLKDGDTLVLAGSIPNTLPADIYERILESLSDRAIRTVVDATKDLLLNVLKYKPFLVKPNNHELGDIVGATITHRDEVEPYARMLQERGARNVLVSMGGEGAVLVPENGDVIMSEVPKGTMVNTVGAGDSMVAGFLTGWIESNGDYETAFKMGVCTGSASAFSDNLATRPEVEALLAKM